tara:strand:+ start:188 stop:892 length:705 start_codon:yes stop_codon:yes gene_type:complete
MNNNFNFQSFLFISPKKIIISVNDEFTFEELYKKENTIKNDTNEISFEYINKFLDENILKIEKKLNSFIEKIILIVDSDDFTPIEISVKKQNHNQLITQESLTYSLNEAKDECKKNFEEKKIVHMLIKNYIIDNNKYSSLPKSKICNNFSLDIKFICIPFKLIKRFEETLKRYQISINRIVSAGYVLSFFSQNEHNIIRNSKDIINGCNENEVTFINKAHKNKGFFEKFFKLFG